MRQPSHPTLWLGILLLCCGVLPGAAAADRLEGRPTSSFDDLTLTVRIVDADRNPVPDGSYAGEVTLLFPFIAGALFGEPDQAEAIRKRVRIGDRLRFDLVSLQRRVRTAARPWRESEQNRPVLVRPEDTRVLRLGALSARDDGSPFADQTLTLDPVSKDALLLVYVDRPCTIRGTARTGSGTADLDIEIPAAGFHWVRASRIDPGHTRLTRDAAVGEAMVGLLVVGRGEASRGR